MFSSEQGMHWIECYINNSLHLAGKYAWDICLRTFFQERCSRKTVSFGNSYEKYPGLPDCFGKWRVRLELNSHLSLNSHASNSLTCIAVLYKGERFSANGWCLGLCRTTGVPSYVNMFFKLTDLSTDNCRNRQLCLVCCRVSAVSELFTQVQNLFQSSGRWTVKPRAQHLLPQARHLSAHAYARVKDHDLSTICNVVTL